ncbi:hypothetical protein [Poseidonocella sp. HB161398]|uniref:hypothetical protein n=1 Tax=Poseidonocella sp. HB161398 TaxID=2320855 RepID=UPI0011086D2C|nr:hypothetical protein [Poseidonocella sp. HB161398]
MDWSEIGEAWHAAGEPWATFASWYEDLLSDAPSPDWPLLERIALIAPDQWEGEDGPQKIAARIAEFRLERGVMATASGERVIRNQETSLFRVEPVTEIASDHLRHVTDILCDALDLFPSDGALGNQFTAISAELDIVRKAVASYADRPTQLHMSCTRVLRRTGIKVDRGECPAPSEDADLDDFLHLVTDAKATLMERDPSVQEAVAARAGTSLRDMSSDEAETIIAAADEAAAQSEGILAEELPDQARNAADATLPIEERRENFVAASGRLLRIYLLSGWTGSKKALEEVESLTKTAAGISKNIAVVSASGIGLWQASPLLKKAVDIILASF